MSLASSSIPTAAGESFSVRRFFHEQGLLLLSLGCIVLALAFIQPANDTARQLRLTAPFTQPEVASAALSSQRISQQLEKLGFATISITMGNADHLEVKASSQSAGQFERFSQWMQQQGFFVMAWSATRNTAQNKDGKIIQAVFSKAPEQSATPTPW